MLRNILPAEIAARLRNGESNIADHYESATVLFADIVGFGKITARMKAYEIIECLNQLFSEFDRLAEASGVEKATWRSQASPRPIRTMREQQPNLRLI
ncbi:MAG: adenylate/guanylate cyclase domain-containing protein [Pseudolabrys sp.]